MKKRDLLNLKKEIVALGLVGTILTSTGCRKNANESTNGQLLAVPEEYSHPDNYYSYVIKNGEAMQLYNANNVYIFFDKDSYEAKEYIYNKEHGIIFYTMELYDLEAEELLVYESYDVVYNDDYYNSLLDSSYQVCLADAGNYIEEYTPKDSYTLDEIKEMESTIKAGLKLINEAKEKKKAK